MATMTRVEIHSKPGCTYCDKAAALLDAIGVAYTKVMYDPGEPGYAARRDAMFDAHGHRSFPNVFVDGKFVGGYAELRRAVDSGAFSEDDDF